MEYTLSRITLDRKAKLYPDIAERFEKHAKAIHEKTDLMINMAQGFRTYSEQDLLYLQGRAHPGPIVTNAMGGKSGHCFGAAYDVSFRGRDPYLDKLSYSDRNDVWKIVVLEGRKLGFKSGVSFGDLPHFEDMYGLSMEEADKLHQSGGTSAVWLKFDELRQTKRT